MTFRNEILVKIISITKGIPTSIQDEMIADEVIKLFRINVVDKLIINETEFPISKKYTKKDSRGLYGIDKGSYNRALLDVEEMLSK